MKEEYSIRNLEKEYPILKEDRRRKEGKTKAVKAWIYLGGGLLIILIRLLFL